MAALTEMSDVDRQKALDIGSSMQLEATTVDSGDKSPDITPTIGDDPPEYGKTFAATHEPEPPPEAVAEPVVAAEPAPVPDSLAGMSEEDFQAARGIGASTPLESTPVDSADKSPDMTPAIGGDPPEYGKTFAATPEPEPVAEMAPEAPAEVSPEVPLEALPEAVPEVTAEAPPEVHTEWTPEVTPGLAQEATPDVQPETTPEVAPEVIPEVVPEPDPVATEIADTTVMDAESQQKALDAAFENQANEHFDADYGGGSTGTDSGESPTPEPTIEPSPELTPEPAPEATAAPTMN